MLRFFARSILQLAATVLYFPSILCGQGGPPADSVAIVEASTAFSRAYERGDTPALLTLYTTDAVIFPDQSDALSGRESLERYWTLRPGNRVLHHQLISTSLTIHGAYAHDWGTFEVSGEQDGKPWGPNRGKYVVVWRKDSDGKWRMQLDIWNRRAPPRP